MSAFTVTFVGFGCAYTFSAFVASLQQDFGASRVPSLAQKWTSGDGAFAGLNVPPGNATVTAGGIRFAVPGVPPGSPDNLQVGSQILTVAMPAGATSATLTSPGHAKRLRPSSRATSTGNWRKKAA